MKPPLSRRRFIGTTLAGAAISTVSPWVFSAAPPAARRPIRKAIMYATIGYKGTVMEKFVALKEAGFEGVEPMSHMKQDEVMAALDATGLKAASVCCATHWESRLSDPSEDVRAKGLEGLHQALRDAKRYGASSVLLVPGRVTESVTFDDCWQRSIASIRKALPLSEETGVKIAVENVWNGFITKAEEARRYLDEINSPQVGWHFDVGNVLRFGLPQEWIPVLGKRILKLHIKEFSKAKQFSVRFFEGDNNWPAIMAELDKVGYSGWGISEMPGDQTKDAAGLQDFTGRMDRIFAS